MKNIGIDTFDITIKKSNEWINELGLDLLIEDKKEVYLILKAVLHSIRDRLTIEETADFAAQMPILIKGVYYEKWIPAKTPLKARHIEEFFDMVSERYGGTRIFEPIKEVPIVLAFLSKKISKGEIKDVKSILPQEIKDFWNVSEEEISPSPDEKF